MPKGIKTKSDDEFFEESMDFFLKEGKNLSNACSDIVDEYNDHSLLKPEYRQLLVTRNQIH